MTEEEEKKRQDTFYNLCTTIDRYVRSINKDAYISGVSFSNDGFVEFTSFNSQILYRISMGTNDNLEKWKRNFNGDITKDRIEEHLSFTDIIMNAKF